MTRIRTLLLFITMSFVLSAVTTAQQLPAPRQIQEQRDGDNSIYKITIHVVARMTTAVNYRQRQGSTPIDFRGTPLLPKARGEAKVETQKGYTEIKVEFDNLEPATRYGSEYLTYVMWAISPEGRATNLGELILDDDKSKLEVTTELQAFGLIVTAEPYFAVTQPSDVVVMENFIRPETKGILQPIEAKYELLQRGQYITNVLPTELKPILLEKKVPLDLYEARNAVRIARWSGADKYAADSYTKSVNFLQQAEENRAKKHWKPLSMMARQAVQTAEDARLIALKRHDEEQIAQERAAAEAREAEAKLRADRAKADADAAELLRTQEALRRAEAESARAAAESQRAAAESARAASEAQAQITIQRAANDRQAAEADAERARKTAAKAEMEKQELRQQLVTQFNAILQTRDSPRGLIVNMTDVLFDTGKSTLKPGAREKLAKISGIVMAHPGLSLIVEGHTDSVGTEEFNLTLSENRAAAVRDFLVQQGVKGSMIGVHGFGESQPVASNDTPIGRQLNRRVEMVVSGEIIGTPVKLTSELNSN